ncbi:tetratricopeptide repeat protein [Allocoleopsis franciscana]|uniref:Probable UDP-N-acetylglucosamine--peptide N-acetylglucosaminyltransferase SPINDLY n=1 Tax=Allocoleopsis franciscana PCC 7113 TaxID=1173027 RepID=K9WIU6_9CYAN|nr:glycosyltransferase family 41 protein [Allocoleopsis franciscana]AFZ20335.1 putative O-linked N-acetylglucosamine transferase, SPINDLY family [Allocoleopsis franciscana PCC 7113]
MINISEAIVSAFQFYQTGNLSHAEWICQQILQQQPNSTEALDLLGRMAHQVGKLEEAIAYYQKLIALLPDYAEAYYRLGSALQSKGQLAEAIAFYQHAIKLQPDYTEAHYNLGYAFHQQGNLPAAIEHYQQAIALNPNQAEAHANLAHILQHQGQIEAAITHYQQAIAIKPDVPEIFYNLGNLLKQQNQLDAAMIQYQWALALNPNYIDAHLQLGTSLHSLGKYEEAIICYQQALTLEPNVLDTYLKLGWALMHLSRFEKATHCFQQALILNPEHPEVYQKLALALASQNQLEEAITSFQKALHLNSNFVEAYWQSHLLLPILYDTQEQIQHWRQRFCRGLNHLIQQSDFNSNEGIRQILAGLTASATTFLLSYQGFNDRGIQRKYGTLVHRVMATIYPQWTKPMSMPQLSHQRKIRVGYLSAYFRTHTVASLTLGWLKNCDKEKLEIYSYYIGSKADLTTAEIYSNSDKYYHIYGDLNSICEQVIADKLHILVFTDIGMDSLTTYIAGLRLAPIQCMTWGHPVTSGLPTIDYFLSSDLMEPQNAQSHYWEKLVRLPNIGICYQKPVVSELTKSRSELNLREDTIIYLCCQSLFKYLPQFDTIFPKIAQRVPQAQFAFVSHPVPVVTAQFITRLSRAFANLKLNYKDYCVILPRLERVDYFNLNLVSNVFLDTFSWSGGNTTLEAIACGLPIVTCPGEFMRSRHSYGILKRMGITETIAQDEIEYVEIAVRLGIDTNWRQEIVQKIYERHHWLYNDKTCVTALEDFYQRVVLSQLGKSDSLKKTNSGAD